MSSQGRRIIDFPEIQTAADTDFFIVDTSLGARKISNSNVKDSVLSIGVLNDLSDVDVASAATGQVLTKTAQGWGAANVAANLNDLTDVDTTGVTSGQTLIFGGSGWGVGTPVTTLGNLTDVDTGGAQSGQLLTLGEGGTWSGSSLALTGLSDVNTFGAQNGDALVFNAGSWASGTPSMAIQDLTDVGGEGALNNQLLVYTSGEPGGWGPQTISTAILSDWPAALVASQITALAAGTAIQTVDTFPMVQGATAVEQTGTALLTFVGSNLSSVDAELAALAGLTSAADKAPYFTGVGTAALMDFTGYGRSIAATANEPAFKALVNLEIGTDVQAYDAGLQSISGLTTAADQILYLTDADTYAVTALTTFARTLLDDNDAAEMRGTLEYPNSGLTDNRLLRTDGTAGVYQQSGVTLDDSNNVTGVNDLDVGGTLTGDTIGDSGAGAVAFSAPIVAQAGRHRDYTVNIADNAVDTVNIANNFVEVTIVAGTAVWARILARGTVQNVMTQELGSLTDVSTAVLTGTTGVDGRCTVSVNTGVIYIENRFGTSLEFRVKVNDL